MILSMGGNWVDFFRDHVGSFAESGGKHFEARGLIEQCRPSRVGEAPEIPGLVMQRPALMTGHEANCTLVQYPVELDDESPRHEYVFENGDRHHRIKSQLRQQ